jgi:hypothetical protein
MTSGPAGSGPQSRNLMPTQGPLTSGGWSQRNMAPDSKPRKPWSQASWLIREMLKSHQARPDSFEFWVTVALSQVNGATHAINGVVGLSRPQIAKNMFWRANSRLPSDVGGCEFQVMPVRLAGQRPHPPSAIRHAISAAARCHGCHDFKAVGLHRL